MLVKRCISIAKFSRRILLSLISTQRFLAPSLLNSFVKGCSPVVILQPLKYLKGWKVPSFFNLRRMFPLSKLYKSSSIFSRWDLAIDWSSSTAEGKSFKATAKFSSAFAVPLNFVIKNLGLPKIASAILTMAVLPLPLRQPKCSCLLLTPTSLTSGAESATPVTRQAM